MRIVKGPESWRQATQSPNEPELRNEIVGDQSESAVSGKLKASPKPRRLRRFLFVRLCTPDETKNQVLLSSRIGGSAVKEAVSKERAKDDLLPNLPQMPVDVRDVWTTDKMQF